MAVTQTRFQQYQRLGGLPVDHEKEKNEYRVSHENGGRISVFVPRFSYSISTGIKYPRSSTGNNLENVHWN